VPAHARCPSQAAEEPRGGELARGTSPSGTPFSINGLYFGGPAHGSFSLDLSTRQHSESQLEVFQGHPARSPFLPSLGGECPPAEWSVVYGVLKKPGTSVTAVTAGGEVRLATVPIPADLHAGGVLAYGAFAQTPQRLIVRDGAGHVIAGENLAARAKYKREFCEGYGEP
jgi:hypothetical protein